MATNLSAMGALSANASDDLTTLAGKNIGCRTQH